MLFSHLRNLFGKPARPAPARRLARGRVRLGVETLEDRLVMSAFAVVGDQLLVSGTGGNDSLQFIAGDAPQVTLNDETYAVDPSVIHSIAFDGAGGNVQATLTDTTTGFDTELDVHPGSATMWGANYTLTMDNAAITSVVAYGSVNGLAALYGADTGTNTFVGDTVSATLTGDGFRFQAVNFGVVQAQAGTAADQASLSGSASDASTFQANATGAVLVGTNFQLNTSGFSQVSAYAGSAADWADFNGNATAKNTFVGTATFASLTSNGYLDTAYGFSHVTAQAGTAADTAKLVAPNSGVNIFKTDPFGGAYLYSSNWSDEAHGFGKVSAYAGTAADQAQFYAPAWGPSTFLGMYQSAQMHLSDGAVGAPNYFDEAFFFHVIYAYAGTAADVAYLDAPSSGTNTLHSEPGRATMGGDGYLNVVRGFQTVTGDAGTSSDVAYLTGSASAPNQCVGMPGSYVPGEVYMVNSANGTVPYHLAYARDFNRVYAYAGTSSDEAWFFGSPTTINRFYGNRNDDGSNVSYMQGSNYFHSVAGFNTVYADAATPSDVAYLYGSSSSENYFTGKPDDSSLNQTSLTNSHFKDHASSFRTVYAYEASASDIAWLYGSTASKNTFVGARGDSTMSGASYSYEVFNFHWVYGYAATPADFSELIGDVYLYKWKDSWAAGTDYFIQADGFETTWLYHP
jgi:hypothetical protein